MTISDGYVLKITKYNYWWANNYFYSELYKQHKVRAAWGMMNGMLDKIKRRSNAD